MERLEPFYILKHIETGKLFIVIERVFGGANCLDEEGGEVNVSTLDELSGYEVLHPSTRRAVALVYLNHVLKQTETMQSTD